MRVAHLYTIALVHLIELRRPKRIGRFGSIIGWTSFYAVNRIRHGVKPDLGRRCTNASVTEDATAYLLQETSERK